MNKPAAFVNPVTPVKAGKRSLTKKLVTRTLSFPLERGLQNEASERVGEWSQAARRSVVLSELVCRGTPD